MRQAPRLRPPGCSRLTLLFLSLSALTFGENVVLKNGIVYRGVIDQDNTIVFIFDGLKRVVVRGPKIARIESRRVVRQPRKSSSSSSRSSCTAASMPKEAFGIKATPWNDKGRRQFEYVGASRTSRSAWSRRSTSSARTWSRLRGVDGFWQDGRLATKQVPREVVLGILAKVDRNHQNERLRVARFLIQAEWYGEAKARARRPGPRLPRDASARRSATPARSWRSSRRRSSTTRSTSAARRSSLARS